MFAEVDLKPEFSDPVLDGGLWMSGVAIVVVVVVIDARSGARGRHAKQRSIAVQERPQRQERGQRRAARAGSFSPMAIRFRSDRSS